MTIEQDGAPEDRNSMLELAQGMPTPRSTGEVFALFAALELARVEDGTQTLDDARDTLRQVFEGEREQSPDSIES